MSTPFEDYLTECQHRINTALPSLLQTRAGEFAEGAAPLLARLFEAINYSLLSSGKRVRPVLVYASARAINRAFANDAALDAVAAAVECLHAYSLVHDDLPAMDDDELRRGRPSCHIAYDEATAILVGDALQATAFELLAGVDAVPASRLLTMLRYLAAAGGARGMVGGQAIDLSIRQPSLKELESMHQLKTGALLRAAIRLGALYAGADAAQLARLDTYGTAIGLAFQVQDDILDVEGDTAELGKPQGSDAARSKATYPAVMGMDAAKAYAAELQVRANEALAGFDQGADRLRELASFIVSRSH